MKNKALKLCIIPLLLLCSCDISTKNKSSDYQTLQYGEALSNSAKANVINEVNQRLVDVVSASKTTETSIETSLSKNKQIEEITYKLYKNNIETKTKTSSHIVSNDIEYDTHPTEITNNVWECTIAKFKRYVSYNIDENDIVSSIKINSDGALSNPLFNMIFMTSTDSYLAFQANGGYEFVYSTHTRLVSYMEVGGQTKEVITEQKAQHIVHFNTLYQFQWSSYVASSISSTDPETGELYDSPKEIGKMTSKMEATYGELQIRDIKDMVDALPNNVTWNLEPLIRTGTKQSSNSDSDFTVDSSAVLTSYVNVVSNNCLVQKYTIKLSSSGKTALFGKMGVVIYYSEGGNDGAKTVQNIPIEFTSSSYYLYTASTTEGNIFYYLNTNYNSSITVTLSISYINNNVSVAASAGY